MSTNPFGDDHDDDKEILEGFICPICREDLKSLEFLISHFEKQHPEDDDLKTTFREIFSKAKKKIKSNFEETFDLSRNLERNAAISRSGGGAASGNSSDRQSNARSRMNCFNFMDYQEVGREQQHMELFQSVRNPRLERYASETNKLIIRLHKLLKDMPTDAVLRKQHEQNIVPWLDGSSVKLCPNCAKSFNITRRKHHCRICGSIMCHDCSKFLAIEVAMELASLTMSQSEPLKMPNEKQTTGGTSTPQQQYDAIRSCDHCLWLLETRQEMHESRTCRPPITQIYADIQQLKKKVMPDIEMYLKIVNSLYEGESIFTLNDASALRGKIGQIAEAIDILSKRILALPCEPGTREESLKKSIRLSCIQLIKENMLSLPPLPKEDEIRQIQERKRMETEMRIATERRLAMEAYERYGLADSNADQSIRSEDYAQGTDMQCLDNWTAHQIRNENLVQSDDPLVEQINIIKGYIKQARQDLNFEVVETLEMNLRELQKEFYERQRSLSKTANTPTDENATVSPTN
ncbi:rabenosyn-5 [Musca vetustissima]|uniref:rabenosyn-5 n=1 Tax=Musca vetustissima TaxID=27455 RepID=UPI002AB62165|nr:rabenosyn-5 [Musca vetustissima]